MNFPWSSRVLPSSGMIARGVRVIITSVPPKQGVVEDPYVRVETGRTDGYGNALTNLVEDEVRVRLDNGRTYLFRVTDLRRSDQQPAAWVQPFLRVPWWVYALGVVGTTAAVVKWKMR